MLTVEKISKKFGSGDTQVIAINNVSFSIKKGEFISIVGRSGSGKSTLLSLLGALDKPTSGQIVVEDQDITKLNGQKLTKYRANKIGFIFQGYNLIPNLTAIKNVMLPMEFSGINKSERLNLAISLLKAVDLKDDQMYRKPGKLSGGQQQRVAIARALANNPSIILADEPTGNLDSQTGDIIFKLLKSLAKKYNTTIIIVTHDLDIAKKTDVTFSLKDGKIKEK